MNKYGLDDHYFKLKLNSILDDIDCYSPSEMARELCRLADCADSAAFGKESDRLSKQSAWDEVSAVLRTIDQLVVNAEGINEDDDIDKDGFSVIWEDFWLAVNTIRELTGIDTYVVSGSYESEIRDLHWRLKDELSAESMIEYLKSKPFAT